MIVISRLHITLVMFSAVELSKQFNDLITTAAMRDVLLQLPLLKSEQNDAFIISNIYHLLADYHFKVRHSHTLV